MAYTKKASLIGKKIQIAVRAGGPDPDVNRALGLVIKVRPTGFITPSRKRWR